MQSGRSLFPRYRFLLAVLVSGCGFIRPTESLSRVCSPTFSESSKAIVTSLADESQPGIRQASFQALPLDGPSKDKASDADANPFLETKELSIELLIDQVLARNPSLAQMTAAWQAASARYPQVTSLEDPMFGVQVGPAAFGSNRVEGAYRLEISQKLPFPGKLALRGDKALAEADAAGQDVEDIRLQLVEKTRTAFYDYYLAERGLEVNQESLRLLEAFRKEAQSLYENNRAIQQDVLQARVEIGRERERRLALEESRKITVARINTLLHLAPESSLPPPPNKLEPGGEAPEIKTLRAAALARRPELRGLADQIRAEQASLALTQKDFRPDFEVMAAYDSFWQERELRPQVGVRLNMPIYRDKRYAAVAEAQAKIAQRQAELARRTDQVNFEVQEAYEKLRKSEQSVRLYRDVILPDSEKNVKAARAAYESGKITALGRIEAERDFVMLRDRYFETLADYFRRRATLDRAIGEPATPTR